MRASSLLFVSLFVGIAVGQLSSDIQNAFLTGHNNMRSKYGVAAVSWSATIAQTAQTYSSKCQFVHSSSSYGENIYAAGGGSSTVAASDASGSLTSWNGEEANYNCLSGACASGKVCGHFTQVTWQASTQIGCGITYCTTGSPFQGFPNWKFVVCNYSPAGNNGQRPFPVANCPSSSSNPLTSTSSTTSASTLAPTRTSTSTRTSSLTSTRSSTASARTTSGGSVESTDDSSLAPSKTERDSVDVYLKVTIKGTADTFNRTQFVKGVSFSVGVTEDRVVVINVTVSVKRQSNSTLTVDFVIKDDPNSNVSASAASETLKEQVKEGGSVLEGFGIQVVGEVEVVDPPKSTNALRPSISSQLHFCPLLLASFLYLIL